MAASSGSIRAGRAFVELFADDTRLVRTLRRAQAKLRAFADSVRAMGATMLRVGAVVLAPIIAVGRGLTLAASEAEATRSRFGQLFGDMTGDADAFAKALANRVGRSIHDLRSSMASFQGFFVGLGFGGDEALTLSSQLQTLAIDFASFNDLSDAEGMDRFISALSGSSEVLDRFGINIKAAALDQELLRMGIEGGSQAASEQAKVLARLGIIAGAMGDQGAIGDAERTADEFANTSKRLRANLLNLAVAIGDRLLPIMTPWAAAAADAVARAAKWVQANKALITSAIKMGIIVAGAAAAIAAVGAAMITAGVLAASLSAALGLLAAAWSAVGVAIGVVGAAIAALLSPIGLVIAAAAGIGVALLYATGAGGEALAWLGERFASLGDTVRSVMGGIADAIMAGDLKLAAQIAWLGLKQVWTQGLGFLQEGWARFTSTLTRLAIEAFYGVQMIWNDVVDGITDAWRAAIAFVRDGILKIMGLFGDLDSTVAIEMARRQDAEEAAGRRGDRTQRDQALGRELVEALDVQAANRKAELQQVQAGLAQAAGELQAALDEAREGRAAADAAAEPPDGPSGTDVDGFAAKMRELIDQLRGQGDAATAVGDAIDRESVRGTFNPAAIEQAFGTRNDEASLLKEIINLAKPIERGVDDIRGKLPAFA